MPPSAHLTRHARERIGDRLSMDDGDVVAILDHDLAVLVGTRAGRLHRLFFGPTGEQCFVAIQDQERNSDHRGLKAMELVRRLRAAALPQTGAVVQWAEGKL